MIYITGDTHGEQSAFSKLIENGEAAYGPEDYVIVCGDFGYIFRNDDSENMFLDELEKKPYTICFCDGNHENFPAIYAYPKEKWNGGYIHRIRKNIVHMMRGQVFVIAGKKVFTFGGAYSIDRYMRIPGRSVWDEELPNNSEYIEATRNLKENDNIVDIIITHTAPREIIRQMGRIPNEHDMELTGFLEWIMYTVRFCDWYFGHWHINKDINTKFHALYYDVKKV